MKKILSIIFFCILFLGIQYSHAQINQNDVDLTINPEFPNPEQEVSATLESYAVELSRASIVWKINGQTKESGIDKKSFKFKSPKAGESLTLDVLIYLSDGTTLSKNVVIRPGHLDVFWETIDSYTPPFYKGKALPVRESLIKVVALPQSQSKEGVINYKNAVYEWGRNYKNYPDLSGYGKNSFIFSNSYNETRETITVTASSLDGNSYIVEKTIYPQMVNPVIIFYEEDENTGILYRQAFSSLFPVLKDSIKIKVEPYFFSTKTSTARDLSYNWTINGSLNMEKGSISIPNSGENTPITLEIESIPKLFQSAQKSITIPFK